MNTYEIVLICTCGHERRIGFVIAHDRYEAIKEARWRFPDVRHEEMLARVYDASPNYEQTFINSQGKMNIYS